MSDHEPNDSWPDAVAHVALFVCLAWIVSSLSSCTARFADATQAPAKQEEAAK